MRHRVVVIGAGFGGLFAIKALRNAPVDITLVNGTAYHLFQPLLYQLATGILSEGEIAPPIREILKKQKNVDVKLGWAQRVDVDNKTVYVEGPGIDYTVEYDTLIVSAGSSQSYFGHEEYANYAPGMKSVDNALELRARIFAAFEIADLQPDPAERERWMTFVIVGAGPTGTEMAGQVAELAHRNLPGQYKHIDPRKARIILVDALGAVLSTFGDHLSTRALRQLHLLGVEVELNTKVVGVDATGIDVDTERGRERIESMTKVWAAGVSAPPLARQIADAAGAKTDRAGRIFVERDLTVPGHPEIIAVGDMINVSDEHGEELPGVAQVAIQGGKYAAKTIKRRLAGKSAPEPFKYFDKGSLAVISRSSAVASIGKVHLSGFAAWLIWVGVHLFYLVGFKNRITAVLHWAVSFLGRGRSERVSTVQQAFGRQALQHYGDPFERVRAETTTLAATPTPALGPEPDQARKPEPASPSEPDAGSVRRPEPAAEPHGN